MTSHEAGPSNLTPLTPLIMSSTLPPPLALFQVPDKRLHRELSDIETVRDNPVPKRLRRSCSSTVGQILRRSFEYAAIGCVGIPNGQLVFNLDTSEFLFAWSTADGEQWQVTLDCDSISSITISPREFIKVHKCDESVPKVERFFMEGQGQRVDNICVFEARSWVFRLAKEKVGGTGWEQLVRELRLNFELRISAEAKNPDPHFINISQLSFSDSTQSPKCSLCTNSIRLRDCHVARCCGAPVFCGLCFAQAEGAIAQLRACPFCNCSVTEARGGWVKLRI